MNFATVAQSLRTRLDAVLPLHVTLIDSKALIQAVLADVIVPLRRRHVRIVAQGDSLPWVLSDRDVLHRALVNVIMNTAESMPAGGLILIRAFMKGSGTAVDIEISDSGTGIPTQLIAPVLEDGFTTKASRQQPGPAICREILQAHGARIELFSTPNKGTTIRLSFHSRVQTIPGAA